MNKILSGKREVKLLFTPEKLTNIYSDEIFVFGSNESGFHGKGAAKQALNYGAIYCKGIGLVGNTYAIPTKDINVKTLPLEKISAYVKEFIEFTKTTPDKIYLVTKIGCGLAGYTVNDIAPLFAEANGLENIILPEEFVKYGTEKKLIGY